MPKRCERCLVGMSELDMFWKYYIVSMNNIANKLGNDEGEVGVYFHRIFNSISTIVRTITDKQYSLTIRNQCNINSDRSKRSLDRLPISDASELNERKNSDTSRPHRRRRHRHRTEREQEMRSSFRRRGRQARGRKHRNVELKPGSVDHPKEVGKQRIRPPFELLLEEAPLPHKPLAFEQIKKNDAEIIVDEEIPVNVEFNPGTHIKRFADELNTTKDFFATFADDLCSSSQPVAFQVSNYGFCWNGEKMAETYDKPIPDNGIEGQFLNPEVKVVTLKREVQTVIEDLRKISKEILETVADIDLPAPIMHSPFYVTPDLSISEIPCDDEDDCFDVEGSAEQSGQEPAQPKGKLATPMYEPFPIEKTDVYFKPVITEDRPVLTTVRPFVNKSESSAKVPLLEQKDGNAKNITVSTLILSGDGRGVASRLFSRKLVELFLFAFFAMFIAQRE
uniref:Uncharacterized protein n=1 Tax=Ciona savignyi TaxID=51511 RepID=H2YE30_CIOSA